VLNRFDIGNCQDLVIAKSENQEAGTTTAILAILAVLAIAEERQGL
jgi:hypothetical protein